MSKYRTGDYVITLFDERGTKVDQFPVAGEGLLKAQAMGYELIKEKRCTSFNIHRNVYNSMDPKPW